MTDLELDDLLHHELCTGLSLEEFDAFWAENVGDPVQELCSRSFELRIPKRGKCTIYVLRGGLVALCDGKGKWSGYEQLERVEEREYLSAWADFARGYWSDKVPESEGVYPTRSREGYRGIDRKLQMHGGKLIDVSRGFVGAGKVTEYRGQFWSLPYPRLRGAI